MIGDKGRVELLVPFSMSELVGVQLTFKEHPSPDESAQELLSILVFTTSFVNPLGIMHGSLVTFPQ